MARLSRLLAAGGLVIVTGPLSATLLAQDYVDVEAERAATTAGRASSSTDTYPATSYGLDGIAPPAPVMSTASAAPVVGGGEQNLANLFLQIQQLQQDVMRLNGIVEEQAYELRTLKEQSLERYIDLDRRMSGAVGTGAPTGGSPPGAASTPSAASGVSSAGGAGQTAEKPGEGAAYQAAYALVSGRQFPQAVGAFKQFLMDYPDGRYTANAHYWLGELYLVVEPQDLESARQSFTLLVNSYPTHPKVPDALYKLGKVHFLKGNRERAREYLDGLIKGYGDTSAAKLAKDFIAENY